MGGVGGSGVGMAFDKTSGVFITAVNVSGWLRVGVNILYPFASLLLPVSLVRSLSKLIPVASIVQRGSVIAISRKILRAKKTSRPIGGENAPVIHVILSQIFSPKS
jgi:hypothetical protein